MKLSFFSVWILLTAVVLGAEVSYAGHDCEMNAGGDAKAIAEVLEETVNVPRRRNGEIDWHDAVNLVEAVGGRLPRKDMIAAIRYLTASFKFEFARGPMGRVYQARDEKWTLSSHDIFYFFEVMYKGYPKAPAPNPSLLAAYVHSLREKIHFAGSSEFFDFMNLFNAFRLYVRFDRLIDVVVALQGVPYFQAQRQTPGGGIPAKADLPTAINLAKEALVFGADCGQVIERAHRLKTLMNLTELNHYLETGARP